MTSERPGTRRLLIVDDHEVVRVGLRALLAREDWVERCVPAASHEEALTLADRYEPHVALVDLFIGTESGVELCRQLRDAHERLCVLLMSGNGRVSPAVARAAGASGFLSKSWPAAKLVQAVRIASAGKPVRAATEAPANTANLTARELDVLRQIAAGASNPEAARSLHLSPHTVKQYTSSLYRKLDVQTRTEAVLRAQRLGLIY